MLKYITLLNLSLLFLQTVQAQQAPKLYYMRNSGTTVQDKDSADYYRLVFPPDTVKGYAVYKVHEFYLNQNPRSLHTEIMHLGRPGPMEKQGICYELYPNRQLKRKAEYDYGVEIGDVTRYYTNGKIYCIMKHSDGMRDLKLVECRDSTGKVTAKDGKGYWMKLDDSLSLISEGPISDSLENGNWHGIISDSSKYECLFVNGIPKSGIGYDKSGKAILLLISNKNRYLNMVFQISANI